MTAVNVQKFVATFVLVTFLAVVAMLCWHVVPPDNKDSLEIMLGFIGGSYKDVIAYFFGSTDSSKAKDATISNLAASAPPPAS